MGTSYLILPMLDIKVCLIFAPCSQCFEFVSYFFYFFVVTDPFSAR